MSEVSFDYSIFDAIKAMSDRKFMVLSWIMGSVLVVGLITLLIPKSYVSEGKLFVRLGRENSSLDPANTLNENSVVAVPLYREAEINSVTEVINNRSIFEKVVNEIGAEVILDKAPFNPEGEEPSEEI
ncbi:MAG: hypothetical protein AAGA30_04265, partial [Planctomycetota bacterium]